MTNTSKSNQWQLSHNGKDIYTLKLSDNEGTESLWVTTDQLAELQIFLSTLTIPLPEGELPL